MIRCFRQPATVSLLLVAFSWIPLPAFAQDSAGASVNVSKILAGGVPKTVAELKAMEQRVRQLSDKLIQCTVGVTIGNAQGSGVIVSKDGYVLTAAHVAGRPNRNVQLILPNGRKVRAKTLGMNKNIDSGLMKITEEGEWPFVEMGDSTKVKEGQWIIGTGHPNGYQNGRKPVLRVGRVLANLSEVMVSDVTLVSGDSGGPLFDMDGKVIGIHSRIDNPLTMNMHVPTKTYQDTWDRLAAGEQWGNLPGRQPFIGVRGDEESEDAKVTEVFPDTPADKAGMKSGDVIKKFDGKDVPNFQTLKRLVSNKQPGDRVKVEVQRDADRVTLNLVIGLLGG